MPAPELKQESDIAQMLSEDIMKRLKKPPAESHLAQEIAELRREIQALRHDLAPVSSHIITGRAAMDEFKRLTCAPAWRPR